MTASLLPRDRRTPHPMRARAVTGVLLALIGSGSLTLIGLLAYGRPEGYGRVLFDLGMPLAVLASATAQVLVLVGLWLLWSAVHHPRA